MKWLSNGFRTIFWCMTLGAVILGSLSVFLEAGHKTARAEEMRAKGTGIAISNAAALPNLAMSKAPRKESAECSEALDALALCALSKDFKRQPSHEEARLVDQTSEKLDSRAIVNASQDPVETSFPFLPVLAFGLAVVGVLTGAFNFCAILIKQGRENALPQTMAQSTELLGKENTHQMVVTKRSATAAVAKARLLQFRA